MEDGLAAGQPAETLTDVYWVGPEGGAKRAVNHAPHPADRAPRDQTGVPGCVPMLPGADQTLDVR